MLSYDEANHLRYRLVDLDLPEDLDRAQFHALLTAGVREVLHQELDAIAERRDAPKAAAVAVSQAADWSAVARRLRDRNQATRSGGYIPREVTA
jgi:hypothetical protein